MSSLVDSCEVLGQNLIEANRQCKDMKDELDQFTAIVSTVPPAMMKLRLTTIACQIVAQAFTLRTKHDGKGFVYVMAGRNALDVHWSQHEYSNKDKEWFESRGFLIAPPEAIDLIAKQFIEQLDSGEWMETVNWLNQYGTGLISNHTNFSCPEVIERCELH